MEVFRGIRYTPPVSLSLAIDSSANRSGASPALNWRTEALEHDAGIGGGEAPVDRAGDGVASLFPSSNLLGQGVCIGDAAVHALAPEHAQLDLGFLWGSIGSDSLPGYASRGFRRAKISNFSLESLRTPTVCLWGSVNSRGVGYTTWRSRR